MASDSISGYEEFGKANPLAFAPKLKMVQNTERAFKEMEVQIPTHASQRKCQD
jgi:hypothetical protein